MTNQSNLLIKTFHMPHGLQNSQNDPKGCSSQEPVQLGLPHSSHCQLSVTDLTPGHRSRWSPSHPLPMYGHPTAVTHSYNKKVGPSWRHCLPSCRGPAECGYRGCCLGGGNCTSLAPPFVSGGKHWKRSPTGTDFPQSLWEIKWLCLRGSDVISNVRALAQSSVHSSHDTFLTLLRLQILHSTENSDGPDESNLPGWHLPFIFQSPVKGHTSHLAATAKPGEPGHLLGPHRKWCTFPEFFMEKRGLPVSSPHCANTGSVEQPRRGSEAVKCVSFWGSDTLDIWHIKVAHLLGGRKRATC